MVHAGCVFVAGIHPSRTWMSGSFESVRWNACVHRLDLHLYSHQKQFLGNGVRTLVNSKGKITTKGKKFSPEKDRTHNTASSTRRSPTHYQQAIQAPLPSKILKPVSAKKLSWCQSTLFWQWTKRRFFGKYSCCKLPFASHVSPRKTVTGII